MGAGTSSQERLLVTGGAGFIGSQFVHDAVSLGHPVLNVDALTYAGNLSSLKGLESDAMYRFVRGDIRDMSLMLALMTEFQPDAIVHFAAESHVDRSISAPDVFVSTNVNGTLSLLNGAMGYWRSRGGHESFRFLHVSTDEVYGSLDPDGSAFTEMSPYAPNSPYSASKAASDHLVRAYCQTYGLPTLVTNCSNNYGARQFPEKLIPTVILAALEGRPVPVYGDGLNVRDWLHVTDHCAALRAVLLGGRPGESYVIGGNSERTNIQVVGAICAHLDRISPLPNGEARSSLIEFVQDRPGHDRRYAIDADKLRRELGWKPSFGFEAGIADTVDWYLANGSWTEAIRSGDYMANLPPLRTAA